MHLQATLRGYSDSLLGGRSDWNATRKQRRHMQTFEQWSATRGQAVAEALDIQREVICQRVSTRMARAFPKLCYAPSRQNARAFQQTSFYETPRRFHRLVQLVLLCGNTACVEREYRWGWNILKRYGVDRRHMQAQVRWYFENAFDILALSPDDQAQLLCLCEEVIRVIDQVTRSGAPTGYERVRRRYTGSGSRNAN